MVGILVEHASRSETLCSQVRPRFKADNIMVKICTYHAWQRQSFLQLNGSLKKFCSALACFWLAQDITIQENHQDMELTKLDGSCSDATLEGLLQIWVESNRLHGIDGMDGGSNSLTSNSLFHLKQFLMGCCWCRPMATEVVFLQNFLGGNLYRTSGTCFTKANQLGLQVQQHIRFVVYCRRIGQCDFDSNGRSWTWIACLSNALSMEWRESKGMAYLE